MSTGAAGQAAAAAPRSPGTRSVLAAPRPTRTEAGPGSPRPRGDRWPPPAALVARIDGLDGIAATSGGLLCDAQKGFAFAVDCIQAEEFALAHWLVNGADGRRLFVRCFGGDGIVRENAAGDVPASLTTILWNARRSPGPAAPPWRRLAQPPHDGAARRRRRLRADRHRRPGRADRTLGVRVYKPPGVGAGRA